MRFKILDKISKAFSEPAEKPAEFGGQYFDGRRKQNALLRLEEEGLHVLNDEHYKPGPLLLVIPYLQMHAVEQFPYSRLNAVFGVIDWIPFGWQWSTTDLFISILYTGEDGLAQYAVFKAKEHTKAFQTICSTVDAYHRKKCPSAYRREPKTLRELNGLPPLDP